MFLMAASAVYFYADEIDAQSVEIKQEMPAPAEQIIVCRAEAFNAYGHDANGVDYGPGYVIISDKSEIPLYSLLDIDQYGEGQAVASSAELTKDEIRLWYNAPSKVPMFGRQTVKVITKGVGDKL
jgi:3D (Asp-Asp-Asp) domain-containing protein